MNKRGADTVTSPIVLLVLTVLIIIVLYVVLMKYPQAFSSISNLVNEICVKIGMCSAGGTCIQSFKVERGLGGALTLEYIFINNKDMASYQLNKSWIAGNTGVSDKWESIVLPVGGDIDDTMRSDIAAGKPFSYTDPSPAALNHSKYTLTVFEGPGSTGKILDQYDVDYLGVFTKDNEKYLPSIHSFMELAQGLGGIAGQKDAEVMLHPDLVMVGFSKDFNEGNSLMRHTLLGICQHWDITVPEECKDQSTCLCLCKSVKDKSCQADGRLCFGYSEYRFIGGTKRDCNIGGTRGAAGEENRPINIYKGQEFDDPPAIFNSLAMIRADPDPAQIPLVITQYNKIFPSNDNVNCLIISKKNQ